MVLLIWYQCRQWQWQSWWRWWCCVWEACKAIFPKSFLNISKFFPKSFHKLSKIFPKVTSWLPTTQHNVLLSLHVLSTNSPTSVCKLFKQLPTKEPTNDFEPNEIIYFVLIVVILIFNHDQKCLKGAQDWSGKSISPTFLNNLKRAKKNQKIE